MNERTARMQPARPPAFPPAFPPPPARPPDRRTSVRRQQARVRRPPRPAQGRRLRPPCTDSARPPGPTVTGTRRDRLGRAGPAGRLVTAGLFGRKSFGRKSRPRPPARAARSPDRSTRPSPARRLGRHHLARRPMPLQGFRGGPLQHRRNALRGRFTRQYVNCLRYQSL